MIINKFLNLVSVVGTFVTYLSIFILMLVIIVMLLIGYIQELISEKLQFSKEHKKQQLKDIHIPLIYPKEYLGDI